MIEKGLMLCTSDLLNKRVLDPWRLIHAVIPLGNQFNTKKRGGG